MIAYLRLELNDSQFNRLLEKATQPIEELKDTPPKVVIYEGTDEADRIDVYPQLLEVTDVKDREGRVILEAKAYPEGKPFEIAIE